MCQMMRSAAIGACLLLCMCSSRPLSYLVCSMSDLCLGLLQERSAVTLVCHTSALCQTRWEVGGGILCGCGCGYRMCMLHELGLQPTAT
jgi:hypothetical protein